MKKINLELVKAGYANGAAEGRPLTEEEKIQMIADAEKAEAPEEGVVQEKEPEERLVDLDKEVLPDPGTPSVETPAVGTEGEEVELDAVEPAIDIPSKDKFTNDLDPAPKTESKK